MHASARLIALLACVVPLGSSAQTAPAIDGPVYAAAYVEVLPGAAAEGAALLRQLREGMRIEAGNARAEVLQETGRATRFVVLSAWSDQKAFDAHVKSGAQSRQKLRTILAAPFDERVHGAFAVAAREPLRAGAVTVASHVDVPPPMRETLEPMLRTLAEASRKEAGSLRFEVQQQANRLNHFTVVEAWADQKAYEAHVAATHTRQFRDKLGPMLGALYDERLYRTVD